MQAVDRPRQVVVAGDLGVEDRQGRQHVRRRPVSPLVVEAAVELVGGGQVTPLPLVEDVAGVDDLPPGDREGDPGPVVLGGQEPQVVLQDVEARPGRSRRGIGPGRGRWPGRRGSRPRRRR